MCPYKCSAHKKCVPINVLLIKMCPHKCSAHKKCVPKMFVGTFSSFPLVLYEPPDIVSKLIYDRALSRTKFGNATRRKRTRTHFYPISFP